MGRKNIKVPEPLFNALRDDKDDTQSWPHYLETECLHDTRGAIGADEYNELLERLDDVEDAANAAEEKANKIENDLTSMRREISGGVRR